MLGLETLNKIKLVNCWPAVQAVYSRISVTGAPLIKMLLLAKIRLHYRLVKYFLNSFLAVPCASIPHIVALVVDVSVDSARPWELTLTTHAQNTIDILKAPSTDNAVLTVIDN